MATVRIGINGMGRIGRLVLRHALARAAGDSPSATRTGLDLEIVAANDLASAEDLAYLLAHDSVHRCNLPRPQVVDNAIHVGPFKVALTGERDPAAINWGAHDVDVVIECTGKFTKRDGMARHLEGDKAPGHVILGAPGKGVDRTIVVGVNEHTLQKQDRLLSNASCTTNALAPVMEVLDRTFGIRWALMGTTHAYTGGQGIVDSINPKDRRRGRAGAVNIVPTTTGAAKAVALVLPNLSGKVDGAAVRVPVPNGSMFDVTCTLEGNPGLPRVLEALREGAASDRLKGILQVSDEPLVSTDILGNSHSSIVDAQSCHGCGPLLKLVGWYDNEWGYSGRLLDLVTVVRG